MAYNRTGRASVSALWPKAFAVCDRCGMVYNYEHLIYQAQWAGPRLQNLKFLVCESCLDVPQEQLRAITVPANPIPIDTPRIDPYISEISTLPAGTTPTPFGADLPAPTNSVALTSLTEPTPSNETDPVPAAATATLPSSYFSDPHI